MYPPVASKRSSNVTAPPSPGLLLRTKRSENGWAVADVAQVLRLSGEQMTALESDDYANLPGGTYVLGYWTSYARLLEIDIGESIAFHQEKLRDTASGRLPDPESRRRWGNAESPHQHLGLAFALLSVVFLLGIWYWQHPPSVSLLEQDDWQVEDGDAQGDVEVAGAAVRSGEPGGQDEDYQLTFPESMSALPEPNFSEEHDPQQPDPQQPAPEPPVERVAGAENNEVVKTTADGSESASTDDGEAGGLGAHGSAFQGVIAGLNQQPSQPSHQPAQPLAQPHGTISPDTLVFAVDRESWVEVHDGAGKRLIYRTVARGQRVVLQGQPPFSVFVGNAEGVAVQYRGEPVPFTARGDALFARFTVGAQ